MARKKNMKAKDKVIMDILTNAFGDKIPEGAFRAVTDAYKAGINKVVEELRLRGDMSMNFPFGNIRKEAWQDYLKELDSEYGHSFENG